MFNHRAFAVDGIGFGHVSICTLGFLGYDVDISLGGTSPAVINLLTVGKKLKASEIINKWRKLKSLDTDNSLKLVVTIIYQGKTISVKEFTKTKADLLIKCIPIYEATKRISVKFKKILTTKIKVKNE